MIVQARFPYLSRCVDTHSYPNFVIPTDATANQPSTCNSTTKRNCDLPLAERRARRQIRLPKRFRDEFPQPLPVLPPETVPETVTSTCPSESTGANTSQSPYV